MKTRPATPRDARPVELPTAATLPSSFPTESMPVGATMACDFCEGSGVRNYSDDFGDHEIRCSDCGGTGDCDEQEENGK